MKQHKRFFICCGAVMFLSEIWKQWTLTFYINNGQYIWWYFPFQLCSIPMYVCLLLGVVHSEKIQWILISFLMDFGLLAGIFTFFDTSGMHYIYLPLTIHSYAWHVLLIIIGIWSGTAYENVYGYKHSHSHSLLPQDFLDCSCVYLACVLLATGCNLAFFQYGAINMFYINPYLPMSQKVFGTIADTFGNRTGIIVYILSTIFGAWLLHQMWIKLSKLTNNLQ